MRLEMPEAWTAAQFERDERDEPAMVAAIDAMHGKCIMHPAHDSDACPICFPRRAVYLWRLAEYDVG
jgi:hypothetical protein